MPLYEYFCKKDGRFELIRKFSDPPLKACPTCGRKVEKLLSSPAIQFKGAGWYVTDYAGKGKDGFSKESKSKESKDGGSSGKSEGASSEGKSKSESASKADSSSSKTDSSASSSKPAASGGSSSK